MATTAPPEREDEQSSKKTSSEEDLYLLLDCLRYQQDSVLAQKQALTTIAVMCSNSNSSRNLFKSTGGLSYVLELFFSSRSYQVQQAALYTLGCASEKNLVNQLKLCEDKLFTSLTELLDPANRAPDTLITAVAFLSSCLMSSNVQAQRLAKDSGLLGKLILWFKSTLPSSLSKDDGASKVNHELWASIASALSTATNNPQNETNQCLCIKLFPAALSVLSLAPFDVIVVRPAVSLIGSCTANNKVAQDRLMMVGGLKALVNTLQTVVQGLGDGQLCEIPLYMVKALSAAAMGHKPNCERLVELGCIESLLSVLQCTDVDASTRLNVTLCLGMLTEDNVVGQWKVARSEGLRVLVDVMARSQCEELSKATAFVLQCCVDKKKQSPMQTAFNNKIAHINKLLSQEPRLNESIESCESKKSVSKSVFEELANKKLPSKDLVTAWLDNYMPDNASPQPSEHTHQSEARPEATEAVALPDSRLEAEDRVLKELEREKELRQQLEEMLRAEKEKREELEQQLTSKQMTITQQEPVSTTTLSTGTEGPLNTVAHSSKAAVKALVTKNTTPTVESKTNIRYANSARPQPNPIKKTNSQLKHRHKKIKVPKNQTTPPSTVVPHPHTTNKLSLSKRITRKLLLSAHIGTVSQPMVHREPDCSHQCIGCHPRLKCPLVTCKNFFKLIQNDQFTCSYHRRLACQLRHHQSTTTLPIAQLPPLGKQSSHTTTEHAHTCNQPFHKSPVISEGIETRSVSECLSLSDDRDHMTKTDSGSEYIPSSTPPSSDELIEDCSSKENCKPHQQPNSVQFQRGFNPAAYRLLPRTCGPSNQNMKRLKTKSQSLKDITNKKTKSRKDQLDVYNYSTPDGKLKYLPKQRPNIVPKSKRSPQRRAKAVPWTRQEEKWLLDGVKLLGLGQWRHILVAYPFHSSRDGASLRVKYRNMLQ